MEDDFPFQLGDFQVPAVGFPRCNKPSLKLTFSHLKIDGWKITLVWEDLFLAALAVSFTGVNPPGLPMEFFIPWVIIGKDQPKCSGVMFTPPEN